MIYDPERDDWDLGADRHIPCSFHIFERYDYPPDSGIGSIVTRITRCYFENRWGLSIIWGSMTYSSNDDHPHGLRGARPRFIEEPEAVEVGVIMPQPDIVPASTIEPLGSSQSVEMPGYERELWGEPLGYVDAEALWWLRGEVATWPSDGLPHPDSGPYLEADPWRLVTGYAEAAR